ncbi:MAG: AAA family ATPase [Leptolyngbyaceae cyanobacterium T60_A2020_046]|nr:AAA family ATPase [Leptolyngbyaceae cyanobacterium T60_A2020_046]
MTHAVLPPLIQQMLDPAFYPHPVETPIQLIQTHVSYVLLTGDYAYKVKKTVDFGFLDYSTLAKRRHFCEEELRLNQRGAAMLYLAVLPISQGGDRYQLGGDGEPVEYTVKMRQFPQSALLSQRFERGELTEEMVRRLAIAIADFHQAAETSDYIRTFGSVEQIRASIDENYAQTVDFIGGPQTQQQFDDTQAYTDRFFATETALLQDRVNQGWIRACHGDLHLNNICEWQDQLLLFDCIEFNESFRFVDVMFDIAYIVMDLMVKGKAGLAAAFLSEYVEHTGDWEGLRVLPLYVSRQSYVRGKVLSFLLNDPALDDATRAEVVQKAAPYYTLAWQYPQRPAGQVVLMAGLSGSGKTTTARQLSHRIGAIHLRSDAVRKHLAGVPLHDRGDDSLYTPEMTQRTYDRLVTLGIQVAQAGYSVVLDAKYDRETLRQGAIAQIQAANLGVAIVYCTAPIEVLRSRVQQRTGDIADATLAVLAQQHFEPFTPDEAPLVLTVDTMQPVDPQLEARFSSVG